MSNPSVPTLEFRVANFSNLFGILAYFDLVIPGIGCIKELIYRRVKPSDPPLVMAMPLHMARTTPEGDMACCARRAVALDEIIEARIVERVEQLIQKDSMFLAEYGLDYCSGADLPSALETAEDWDGK